MRVYIDSFDGERIWSTDDGPGTEEKKWVEVQILSACFTQVDMSKRGSKTEPCCWIEASGSLHHGAWEDEGIAVIR